MSVVRPDVFEVHWDVSGQPDGHGERSFPTPIITMIEAHSRDEPVDDEFPVFGDGRKLPKAGRDVAIVVEREAEDTIKNLSGELGDRRSGVTM